MDRLEEAEPADVIIVIVTFIEPGWSIKSGFLFTMTVTSDKGHFGEGEWEWNIVNKTKQKQAKS